MSDPLSASSLISLLQSLLPGGTTSPLPHPTDSIAALVHAIHAALQFRLISPSPSTINQSANASNATNTEDALAGESEDIDDNASETATAVDQDELPGQDTPSASSSVNRLPEGWNSRGEDAYVFTYKHDQSSMIFRIRVGRMGGRVQIDAMAEDGAPHTISVIVGNNLDAAKFPIPSQATGGSSSSTASDQDQAKAIGWKSMASLKTFVETYKRDIIAKLIPGLQIPGYTESSSDSSSSRPPPSNPSSSSQQPPSAQPHPFNQDPSFQSSRSPENPYSIGRRDLDPLADYHPPGQRNPLAGDTRGGGMYMDFNHPLFDDRRSPGNRPGIGEGPGGSIQPPGARWDPVGPGFPGPHRPGGNPLGGMGVGDPDFDEMLPPGERGPDMGRMGGPFGGGMGRETRGGFGGFGGNGPFGPRGGPGGGLGGGMGGGGSFGGGSGMFM